VLREAVKQGKQFRLNGDNINWSTAAHDVRMDRSGGGLINAFGSMAVIQNINFPELANVPRQQTSLSDYLLNAQIGAI